MQVLPRPGIAERVREQILDHDPEHPRPQRQVDAAVRPDLERDLGVIRALPERGDDLLHDRLAPRVAEGNDFAAGLELAEEEDVVDQLAGLLDLLTRLLRQLFDVGAGQRRALEQHEQPGQRSAELVRDRGGEPLPQLLVGGQLGWRLEEEDEQAWVRGRLLLAEPPARLELADGLGGLPVRGHDPSLAVEHDDRLAAVRNDGPDAVLVHHSFTIRLPFAYRVAVDNE